MCFRMQVADPRDPDGIDIEYEAHRARDQPDIGWRAPLEIEVIDLIDLSPAHQADVIDQIYARHDHHG